MRWSLFGMIVLLGLFGCGEPRWLSVSSRPFATCKPSEKIDVRDPRWRESLGGLGFAWGCLSVRWGDGPSDVQGLPIQLEKDGKLFGYNKANGIFDTSPTFSPAANRSNTRRFQLHIFPPTTLEQDDPDRPNKHLALCEQMKDADYNCFATSEVKRCWFVMRFAIDVTGSISSPCETDVGKPACELQADFGKVCSMERDGCQVAGKWACAPDNKSLLCSTNDTGTPSPGKEECNGKDDNCDGQVDENVEPKECYDGSGETKGKGECKSGTQSCDAGRWGVCKEQRLPGTETCNGKDDDCDGNIDNDVKEECYEGPAGTSGRGECKVGQRICADGKLGVCKGQVTPKAEDCNNKDDDCNGLIDDKCQSSLFAINTSIDASKGEVDGKPSQYWDTKARIFTFPSLRIPPGVTVRAADNGFVRIKVNGRVEILGSINVAGRPGQSVNCSTSGFGKGGLSAGGQFGGQGAYCDPQAQTQPKASPGGGSSGGFPGLSQQQRSNMSMSVIAGGGGGGGHAISGTSGVGSGGGKGGPKVAKVSELFNLGGGGAGGGCAIAFYTPLGAVTFQPGAGGGGAGGILVIEAVGDVVISGALLAGGGNGGSSATCPSSLDSSRVSGGGGGGGAGGYVRIESKGNILLSGTTRIDATGGRGGGPSLAKGGDGAFGSVILKDADGKIALEGAMIQPPPTVSVSR